MSSMYSKVVGVISKPPNQRSQREVEDLLPWFRKKSELFGSLKPDVVLDIIRNCEFCTRHYDDVIIKQGEKGNCFYIILRGKVSIFINNAISDEDDISLISEKSTDLTNNERGELDRSQFGNYIANLEAGKSFGELALISKECVRNASIITEELTDLLVVNRELYNRSLKAAQQAEFEERTRFVTESPLFHAWQPKYKRQMAMSIRKQLIQYDAKIIRQGDKADVLYFLLRGQAKLSVDPTQHLTQYPNMDDSQEPEILLQENDCDIIHLPPVSKDPISTLSEKSGLVAPSASRRKENKRRLVELSLVGNNDVIGDVEFVLDLKTYLQSATCTQACHVYALDMKNYERLVVKRNPKTVDVIREAAEVKLLSRVSRLHDNQVPVLRSLYYSLALKNRPHLSKKREAQVPNSILMDHSDIVPHRGALIDQYGPGTIFYRTRMREKAKNKLKHKNDNFRGAKVGFGFSSSHAVSNTNIVDVPHSDQDAFVHAQRGDEMRLQEDGHAFLTRSVEDSDESDLAIRKSFTDWASSDRILADLEDRITHWHTATWTGRRAAKPLTVPLKRLTLQEGKEVKPGQKVVLRKKNIVKPHLVVTSSSDGDDDVIHSSSAHGTGLLRYQATSRSRTLSDDITLRKTHSNEFEEPSTMDDGTNAMLVHRHSYHSPSQIAYHLQKKHPRRQYTMEEYQQLKKMFLCRRRSLGFTSLV